MSCMLIYGLFHFSHCTNTCMVTRHHLQTIRLGPGRNRQRSITNSTVLSTYAQCYTIVTNTAHNLVSISLKRLPLMPHTNAARPYPTPTLQPGNAALVLPRPNLSWTHEGLSHAAPTSFLFIVPNHDKEKMAKKTQPKIFSLGEVGEAREARKL